MKVGKDEEKKKKREIHPQKRNYSRFHLSSAGATLSRSGSSACVSL